MKRLLDGVLALLLAPWTLVVLAALWVRGHWPRRKAPALRMLQIVSSTLELERGRGFIGRIRQTDFGLFEHVWHLHSFAPARQDTALDERHTVVDFAVPSLAALKARGYRWTSRVLYLWQLLGYGVSLITRHGVAIIDTADPFLTGIQAYVLARLTGVPYTIEIHRGYHDDYAAFHRPIIGVFRWVWLEQWTGRFVLRHAQRVVVDRDYFEETALRLGVPARKLVRTRLVADLVFYEEPPATATVRRELGLPAEAPLVVCIGRLSREKFPEDVLHAGAEIIRAVPAARLVMAGDGPLRAELEALAQTLGIRGQVDFLGTVRHPALQQLMCAAAVVVCPDAGMSLLEAALSRSPMVAYDYSCHPEFLHQGQAGILVPHRDWQAMARETITLLQNTASARALGERARELIRREHAPERFRQEMRDAFAQLLETPGGHYTLRQA